MKSHLPESRNRNLPPPPAAPAAVRPPLPFPPAPPPAPPGRGPAGTLRSALVFVLIAGSVAAGIRFYVKGVQEDAKVHNQMEMSLRYLARELYTTGLTASLGTETEEQARDLADLPRILTGLKRTAGRTPPEVRIIEGDPPPGNGTGTHQIAWFVNGSVQLIIRVRFAGEGAGFKFLGEANRFTASRREREAAAEPAPPPAAGEKVSEEPLNPR